jgi:hypothetical protein
MFGTRLQPNGILAALAGFDAFVVHPIQNAGRI